MILKKYRKSKKIESKNHPFNKDILFKFKNTLEYYNFIYSENILNLKNSFLLNTEDLNDKEKLSEMFRFINIKNPNINIIKEDGLIV